MSIASEFDSTIENLKSDYEGLENIGADLTNVNKNIQNIRTCLDNIYSSLPKTTGEGSNLSLNTLKGRINVDQIKGNTTQEGTPTPDSPQPINVVTGEQEVLVRGKNLFDNTLPSDIYYHNCSVSYDNGQIVMSTTGTDAFFGSVATTNGTAYTSTLGQLVEVEENTDYTFSTTNNLITKSFITYFDKNKISIGYLFINSASRTITMPSGTKYVCFRIGYGDSTSGGTYKLNVMLERGGTATPYVEHQEQTKTLHLSSKNLLDLTSGTAFPSGATVTSINKNSLTLTGTTAWGNSAYIFPNFEKNTTFTISGKFLSTLARTSGFTIYGTNAISTSGMTSIIASTSSLEANTSKIYSVTFNSGNYDYICIRIWNNYTASTLSSSVALEVSELQLEKGSTATTYEPYYNYELGGMGTYKNRIFRAVEGNSVYDSLSNEIKATLTNDKWYIEKNIGKYLGKDLTWNYYSVTQGSLFRSGTLDIKKASSGFSNYYTCKTMDTRTNPCFYINNDNPYIDVIDSNYTNATTFKTWLTNNSVMFYVPLNTPTYEEITNETLIEQLNELEKMMSYNGTTNINISGNLPMILSVSALKGE